MNSKRNLLFALLAAVALIGGGCGGLGASGSISPATFLLPGIGQATPQPQPVEGGLPLENSPVVAAYTAAPVQ